MMRLTTLLLAVLLTVPAGRIWAGSLEDNANKKVAVADMKDAMEMANTACGTTIAGSLAWETWAKVDSTSHSIGGYCGKAFDGIRKVCEASDEGKAAVKAQVKKMSCSYGGKGKRAVSLTTGTLKYTVDWDSANDADFVESYLKSKL